MVFKVTKTDESHWRRKRQRGREWPGPQPGNTGVRNQTEREGPIEKQRKKWVTGNQRGEVSQKPRIQHFKKTEGLTVTGVAKRLPKM